MANEKKKCPICGTKLKMTDGRWICKECGYYERGADTQADLFNSSQYNTNTQNIPPGSSGGQTAPPQTAGPAPQAAPAAKQPGGKQNRKKKNPHDKMVSIPGVIASIVIIVAVSAGVSLLRRNGAAALRNLWDGMASRPEEMQASSAPDDDNPDQTRRRIWSTPRTAFFQELTEIMFDKPLSEITEEECSRVTALQLDMERRTIYYELDGETGAPLYFDEEVDIDFSDLIYYTGLEWINLPGGNLRAGNLEGLTALNAVFTDNSLEELEEIIPYPENILSLGARRPSSSGQTLEKVLAFPNLQYLSLESCGDLVDISALTQLPDLSSVHLGNCSSLADYSPLFSLTGLEELSLQSGKLKDIDFLSAMPNLTYLSISDSEITSVDALGNCPNLTTLYLTDNYSVEDYTPVGELSQLTDLSLFMTYDCVVPSFEKLTQLERASFSNLNEFAPLAPAVNMAELYLERCYGQDVEVLTSMTKLNTLSLVKCSYHTAPLLEPLTRLPLEQLNLTDSYVFGNIEYLFGIPTLQYLYMDRLDGVIDFDSVPDNEHLLVLSIDGLKIDAEAYGDTKIPLSDHYDLFRHFPNLTELYLADTEIDSIEFVEYLPNLQYLDITDNDVISLKPLEGLSDFWRVDCGDNPITESVSEESDIIVNTDSEYYPY